MIKNGFPNVRPALNLNFESKNINGLSLYSQIDPRITFTRTQTVVSRYFDGKTTIKTEENLLIYSEQFDNDNWTKTSVTVTANSFAAPNGTTTADTITATGANGTIIQGYTAAAGNYTFSIWLRRKTGTGTIQIDAGAGPSTVTITTSWARYSLTQTQTSGFKAVGIKIVTSGDEVYAWGAQLEYRSAMTIYTPTTTQRITNYIPRLANSAENQPRIESDPVTGQSLGLLIEEERTNLCLDNTYLSNLAWNKASGSVTPDINIAFGGAQGVDLFVEDTTNSVHYIFQNITTVSNTIYTASAYVKGYNRNKIRIAFLVSGVGVGVDFDLTTGTSLGGVISGGTLVDYGISTVGNGWYRIWVAGSSVGTAGEIRFELLDDSGNRTYTGNGYNGAFIWGAQLEAGSFPTSLIATTTTTLTRGSDILLMDGTNFSSWYNNSEGTFFVEFTGRKNGIPLVTYNNNNASERLPQIGINSVGNYQAIAFSDFTSVANVIDNQVHTYGRYAKLAMAYAENDYACSINGAPVVTDTLGVLPIEIVKMNIGCLSGGSMLNGYIKKIIYYPQRLSNAQLQNLTT